MDISSKPFQLKIYDIMVPDPSHDHRRGLKEDPRLISVRAFKTMESESVIIVSAWGAKKTMENFIFETPNVRTTFFERDDRR